MLGGNLGSLLYGDVSVMLVGSQPLQPDARLLGVQFATSFAVAIFLLNIYLYNFTDGSFAYNVVLIIS